MNTWNATLSASPKSATTISFAPGGWMSTMNRATARSGEGTPGTMPAISSPSDRAAPTATAPANINHRPDHMSFIRDSVRSGS